MTAHRTLATASLPASSLTASCLAIAASLASLPAMAATVPSDAAEADSPIIVIGRAEGYVASQTVTATKTDTPLIDVPQSIQVVTREKLDDQASYSLADVLRYVPGTTIGQGEGNRDQITLRGQNTTADFFLDGVRDDVQYYRGLYNIERVEVLKGPYALIFGRGGGGGIINRVQKTPDAGRLFVAGRASINSFGAYDLSADVNMPVGDTTALRINGTYENLDNHRDYYGGERYAVNPYLATRLGERWTLGLSYEYVHDDRVNDRGVPSLNGAPIRGYDSQFFGIPGLNRSKLVAHIAKLRLDGELTGNLKSSTTVLYGDYDKIYNNAFPSAAATSQTGTVTLDAYSDPTKRKNFIAQTNLVWDVATGPLDHKLLFGLEYGSQKTDNQRYNRTFAPSNILDLVDPVYPTVTFTTTSRNTHSDVSFFSAYSQDQISLGAHFDVVLGLRYDHFRIKGIDIQDSNRAFGRTDNKVSPRFGLIYKPQENISLYGSYSQSFLPRAGDQFTTLAPASGSTPAQEDLAPEKFTNYELGAKWDIRSNLNATAAVFQLDRTNATTPDPSNPTQTIVVGETRTQGVELALTGNILRNWQMSAGYTYQNGKLRGNGAVRLAQLPRHQVALWNRYDFNDTLGLGLGMVHQSSQYAAIRTSASTTRLPAFTRFDAALFIKASRQIDLQVNIENLLDTHYFADAHNNNNITPGAPLNARFTARVKF